MSGVKELVEARARLSSRSDRLIKKGVIALTVAFVVICAASIFVPIEVTVPGTGTLIGDAPPATLVAPFSGTVSKVLQSPRQTVSAGTELVLLEPASGSSADTELGIQIDLAVARNEEAAQSLKAIQAVMAGRDPGAASSPATQFALSQIYALEARLQASSEAELAAARRVKLATSISANISDQSERKRELVKRGILPANSALEIDALIIETNQRLENAFADLAAAKAERQAIFNQRESLIKQLYTQVSDEVRSGTEKISQLKITKSSYDEARKRSMIVAPASGYIEEVSPIYPSRAVNAGDTLYEITPPSANFTVRVSVENELVTNIDTGDEVRVRIRALKRGSFSYIRGKVVRVLDAPEPMPPGMLMLPSAARRAPEYAVDVALDRLKPSDALVVRSGMLADCTIIVGSRSAAAYLMAPLLQRLKPFSEP